MKTKGGGGPHILSWDRARLSQIILNTGNVLINQSINLNSTENFGDFFMKGDSDGSKFPGTEFDLGEFPRGRICFEGVPPGWNLFRGVPRGGICFGGVPWERMYFGEVPVGGVGESVSGESP